MLNVPPKLASAYNGFLVKKGIRQKNHPFYRKWLRYYLDFCQKQSSDRSNENRLSAFIAKLQDKKQSEFMQKQARHAVSVFYEMQAGSKKCGGDDRQAKANSLEKNAAVTRPDNRRYAERQKNAVQQKNREESVAGERDVEKKSGADWTGLYTELERAIKIRHYSPKTLQSYRGYVRQFQGVTKSKPPELFVLSRDEVDKVIGCMKYPRSLVGYGVKFPLAMGSNCYGVKCRASKLAKFFCPKIGPQDMLTKPDFMRVSASF
jgi:ribosomal protein L12E/L44/L45/RPP1/RPP2